MKNTIGNYLIQANKDFPVDAETFDSIQTNIALLAVLGNIAGDKAVLKGCELEQNNTKRKEGYVFIRTKEYPDGEILFWEGGSITEGMYIKKEVISVTASGYEFPQAYTVRSAAAGVGSENYSWTDFRDISTIPALEGKIADLKTEMAKLTPPPLGIVQMWAGSKVPEGYELCDGRELKITEYPDLYAALGTTFNRAYSATGSQYSTTNGYFRLPDLRGRFIAGYNVSDSDYNTYGKVGGEKKHALTTSEMPSHSHQQYLWAGANGDWRSGGRDSWPNATSDHTRRTTDSAGVTGTIGGGTAHENRPPYYVLAYIIRTK